GPGVPARCPDRGSVTRPPLPSTGSPRYGSPGFLGTRGDSNPCRPVPPGSCARPALPPLRRGLRSSRAPTRPGRPGVFGFGNPSRRQGDEGERQVSPVAGEPSWAFAVFLDPGRTPKPGVIRHRDTAPPLVQTVGSLRGA